MIASIPNYEARPCEYLYELSSIITTSAQINKILSYFPADKRNFKVSSIYKGSREGWYREVFRLKVKEQGPSIVLVKTKLGAICGGFSSKSLGSSSGWTADDAAFVFNLN